MPRPTLRGLLVAALALCAAALPAHGRNPDDCASAQLVASVPFDSGLIDTTAFAANAPGGACDSASPATMQNDLWFKWTPTTSAIVDVEAQIAFAVGVVQVHAGAACGSLSTIACAPGEAPGVIPLSFTATAGQIYFIQAGRRGVSPGSTLVRVALSTRPPNDECDGAITLPVGVIVTADTSMATVNPADPAPSCAPNAVGSLWFSFIAPAERVVVSTYGDQVISPGESSDTVLAAYTGSCGALTQLACNDSGNPSWALASLDLTGLTVGAAYRVQVASKSIATAGLVGVYLTVPPECPQGAVVENEACDSFFGNDSFCNDLGSAAIQFIALNSALCGTHDSGDRDVFATGLGAPAQVTLRVRSLVPLALGVYTGCGVGVDEFPLGLVVSDCTGAECVGEMTLNLPAGLHTVWITQPFEALYQNRCGSGYNDYVLTIETASATCNGDANADGVVDFNDITAVLVNWLTVCP